MSDMIYSEDGCAIQKLIYQGCHSENIMEGHGEVFLNE